MKPDPRPVVTYYFVDDVLVDPEGTYASRLLSFRARPSPSSSTRIVPLPSNDREERRAMLTAGVTPGHACNTIRFSLTPAEAWDRAVNRAARELTHARLRVMDCEKALREVEEGLAAFNAEKKP